MSVRSSVFESLTAIAAVTRSNVISRYTAETDTDSICSMVHHTDTVVAIVALRALLTFDEISSFVTVSMHITYTHME